MTPQTPAVGQPLDAESVRLLVKGDWLMKRDGGPVRMISVSSDGKINVGFGARFKPSSLAFLGRPDQEGWIKHEGGENPTPGMMICAKLRDGKYDRPDKPIPADQLNWKHGLKPSSAEVIAWRPHAPSSAHPERSALDEAASHFIATSMGFSGPNEQDTPLQAAAREVGWMLSEVVDRIEWEKRGQVTNALGRLAVVIDAHPEPASQGREALVDLLSKQLAGSIAGLGYPVGMGVEPPEDACRKAANGIIDLYSHHIAALASPTHPEPLGVDLGELKRLAEAATGREWRAVSPPFATGSFYVETELPCINGLSAWFSIAQVPEPSPEESGYSDGALDAEANAAYIAAVSPAVILKLIAEIERRGRK